MDSIIGEFTIISGSDPSTFHTTFARSVRLEEGYQLGIKSLYHGPVKNLVYAKFKLHSTNASKELELTPRFYRAPSDILLDIHHALANVAAVPLLFEKDGQMKMKMPEGFWIEVNEAMFLNQNFKYVLHEPSAVSRRSERARKRKPVRPSPQLKTDALVSIKEKLADIELIVKGDGSVDTGLLNGFHFIKAQVNVLEVNIETLSNLDVWKQPGETKKLFGEISEKLDGLNADFDELSRTYLDKDVFEAKYKNISDNILVINRKVKEVEKIIVNNAESIDTLQGQVVFLTNAYDKATYAMEELDKSMKRGEEPDKDHRYSIDTSQMASRRKQRLHVSEISVSMKPVEKTILAFLYASPVENSLINDKESRLLAPFPVNSKNGYSYVEFAQPIYRDISVRQFMDISFYILDSNGKKIDFNLYGDDIDQEHREYPTILNLHIRRPGL